MFPAINRKWIDCRSFDTAVQLSDVRSASVTSIHSIQEKRTLMDHTIFPSDGTFTSDVGEAGAVGFLNPSSAIPLFCSGEIPRYNANPTLTTHEPRELHENASCLSNFSTDWAIFLDRRPDVKKKLRNRLRLADHKGFSPYKEYENA